MDNILILISHIGDMYGSLLSIIDMIIINGNIKNIQ